MASIFRLANRQVLNQILRNEKSGMLSAIRPVTLRPQPAEPEPQLGHDEKNMQIGRPMSPHLTIYAPQLTSMLSITHRATGMVMSGYLFGIGFGTLVLPDSIPHYIDVLANYGFLLFLVKSSLAFPLAYHYWNGIRHLCWDFGYFLKLKEIYMTGYVMAGLSVVTGAILLVL